jgi:hypothetical protein
MASDGPLFTKPRRIVILFWAAAAILNVAAGIAIATLPERASDLETIMRWGGGWLADGANVYQPSDPADSGSDYPPHAIVLLAPLSLLPLSAALPVWALVNVALAILAAYLAARFFRPFAPFGVILVPILMFLCWGGARVLTQFSLLALASAMGALALASQRPMASGVLLGVALMKPQVAVPVFLWAVFTRRWRIAATSLSVVALGLVAFCAWSGANVVSVAARYAEILIRYHDNPTLIGLTELRPLIERFVPDVADARRIGAAMAIGLIAGICAAGWQEGKTRRRILYAAPALVACWSLLTFYHLTYGFVVLLPVMMLLALNDTERSPLRVRTFWLLQVALMFDIPGIGRRTALVDLPVLGALLPHADRMLLLMLFAALVVLAWRDTGDERTLPE